MSWLHFIQFLRMFILFWTLIAEVICLTRWHERFFDSREHSRIPSDVTFIDTRHDFSSSMVHPVDARRLAKHPVPASALSPSQTYFSCLPSHAFSFVPFFYRSPLSKPVIAADEYGVEYANANDTPSRGTAQRSSSLNPSILSGSLSRASRLRSRGETCKKQKEVDGTERESDASKPRRRRARTRRKIRSLARYSSERERDRSVILSGLLL